jgi:hypothetical protein
MRFATLAAALMLSAILHGQTVPKSDADRLVGAWHLVSLGDQGPDGKFRAVEGLKGTLIYSRDGHMSVQIMYPKQNAGLTNDYVLNGYEASFGSYDVNEAAHTVTHHVQGSITPGLVGKSLTRVFKMSGRRMVIQSPNPDEHWSATWEHD